MEERTGADEELLDGTEAGGIEDANAAAGERSAAARRLDEEGITEEVDLARLQDEIGALNDRHLRLAAEFDNYRKRVERERAESRIRSQAELIGKLLEPLDDLERVVRVEAAGGAESVVEGSRLVERKLRQVLEAAGLEAVEAEGRPFDPETMEALATVPTDDPSEDDMVADVFQRGYRYQGLLVRPARVRVKKHG